MWVSGHRIQRLNSDFSWIFQLETSQDLDEAEQQKITELLHELCDEHMGTLGLMPKAENKAETETWMAAVFRAHGEISMFYSEYNKYKKLGWPVNMGGV